MKKTTLKLSVLTLTASLALAPLALLAQQPQVQLSATTQPNTFQNAIQSGTATIEARLRYEFVDQDGYANNANAITLRTRLGYTTAPYKGFDANITAENVVAIVNNYFDSVTPKPGYPQVMDPATTEVNQAWFRFTGTAVDQTVQSLTVGRQRIILDNARFVGDVGWRQDSQTFDAIRWQAKGGKEKEFAVTINYAWLWRVNRVQGDQRDWRSNSHLINMNVDFPKMFTLSYYAYLLNFYSPTPVIATTANAASNKTFGISLAGNPDINKDNGTKLNYRIEYAYQTNYGHNHTGYSTHYLAGEFGVTALVKYNLTLGCEQLGSDNGQGFRTPLGTNHAFNGWSDFILPVANNFPNGLRDYYVRATIVLPANLQLIAYYHKFDKDWLPAGSTIGRAYGDEVDASLVYRLNKNITFLVKAASLSGKNGTSNLNKFWLQTEYTF